MASSPTIQVAARIFDPGCTPDDPGLAIGHTLEYVKVAGESTSRARSVFMLLVATAVAAFAAYWNLDHTFVQRRINVMQEALEAGPPRASDPCTDMPSSEAARCLELASVWGAVRQELERTKRPVISDSILRITLRARLDTLRGVSGGDARTMKLPILDLTFEAPDLWLFTGLTFALLLVALVYCVACERRDVGQAFRTAAALGTMRMCHQLLAMQQVLTIPERPSMPGRAAWRLLARALYFVPIAAQGYATFVVIRGRHKTVGGVPEITTGAWGVHITLLVITVALTFTILRLEQLYDGEWDTWSRTTPGDHEPRGGES